MNAGQHTKSKDSLTSQVQKRTFGYNDPELVPSPRPNKHRWIHIVLALVVIFSFWMVLDQKLLFGEDWISPTYDNPDWRTNEGNLHTFGAWDIETHIWKTDYIMQHYPDFHWNPYWYLGMPMFKFYQLGFYMVNIAVVALTGLSVARSTLLIVIFGHLLATLLTFLLAYKVSKRVWPSALVSLFLLANTFISLRSYGWEPITVVFLFLFPLVLLIFLKNPLKPLRFWLILTLALAYLSHPLLWLTLCITMGVYLLSIALRKHEKNSPAKSSRYLWQLLIIVGLSLALGAIQFIPQITYDQVTSGAHMGVKYLPYYQVPYNIIQLKDFFFDAGNLKGPGPLIAIALFFAIFFGIKAIQKRKKILKSEIHTRKAQRKDIFSHELIFGLLLTLGILILFFYMERYRLFPMNLLQSTQFHRVIPEMVILAAVIVAGMSGFLHSKRKKIMYYVILVSFALASLIIVYDVQTHWETSSSISSAPEFITHNFSGRISFPYTDQSLSVRNSFTQVPQVYGYFEQGITNPYADEGFSISSGFHNTDVTLLYLRALHVGRLYVNTQEGTRDFVMMHVLNETLTMHPANERYSYFTISLPHPSFSQAVDETAADKVNLLAPDCRVLFQETYCGSVKEEFVWRDPTEVAYLSAYVDLLGQPYSSTADMVMINPDTYSIKVTNATANTAVIVKMTYDKDFRANVQGKNKEITTIGPHFMLIKPQQAGDYTITLTYTPRKVILGAIVSVITLFLLIIAFLFRKRLSRIKFFSDFKHGDM